MKIITITNENRYFKEYLNLCYNWFGKEKNLSINEIKEQYKFHDKLPAIRVLIINDTLIGFYELNEKDNIEEEDYKPYLANVYVKEEYRKQGYSTILINDSINFAKELGYKDLYLHSRIKDYYEKYNFEFIKEVKTKYGNKRIFKYKGK